MGIFSAIGGFISDCATGIGRVITSVGDALGTFAGSAIKAMGSLVPVLEKWGGNIVIAVQVIGMIIDVVARIVDLLKPDETVPDMGERALQAEEQGITLESCHNDFDAYMEKLHALELDPVKAEKRSGHEQWLAGGLLLEKGLEQKFPQMCTAAMWPVIVRNADFFTKERLATYAEMAMQQKIPFGESVAKYFAPAGNTRIDAATRDLLFAAEKSINPTVTPNDICDMFDKVKDNCSEQMRE